RFAGNTRSGVPAGHTLSRRSTRPGCDWGWLEVLTGLRFAPGAVLLHEIPQPRAGRGTLRTVGAPASGAKGVGSGFWLGSVFAPGAVLLQEIPVAACRRGVLCAVGAPAPGARGSGRANALDAASHHVPPPDMK